LWLKQHRQVWTLKPEINQQTIKTPSYLEYWIERFTVRKLFLTSCNCYQFHKWFLCSLFDKCSCSHSHYLNMIHHFCKVLMRIHLCLKNKTQHLSVQSMACYTLRSFWKTSYPVAYTMIYKQNAMFMYETIHTCFHCCYPSASRPIKTCLYNFAREMCWQSFYFLFTQISVEHIISVAVNVIILRHDILISLYISLYNIIAATRE
jgi:hypothetical protein